MRYRHSHPVRLSCAVLVALLVVGSPPGSLQSQARAESPERIKPASSPWQPPGAFSLARVVPADACLYVHWTHNPERDALRPHYKTLWREVWTARPHDLLKESLATSVPPDRRQAFEQGWQRALERLDAVDWDALTKREVVLVARMKGLAPQILLLLDAAESAAKNAAALRETIEALAEADEDLQSIGLDMYDAKTLILTSVKADTCLQMAHRGNVIALCYGSRPPDLMDDVLGLLSGNTNRPRLIDSPRFAKIMQDLPRPEDDLAFIDVGLAVRQSLRTQTKPDAATPSPTSGSSVASERVIRRLMQLLDVYDYSASVGWTEGHRQHHKTVTAAAIAKQPTLAPALCKQKPFDRFDRFVPAGANAFWLWPGANPAALYDAVLTYLKAEADDPDAFMAEWKNIEKQIGLSVRDDLLEWLDGRGMLVGVPSKTEGSSESDLVLILGLADAKRADAKLDRLAEWLQAKTADWTPPVSIKPDALKGAGDAKFRRVTLGESATATMLVFGIVEQWLLISTSPAAVADCLATARGKAQSITQSKRFQTEGLLPEGKIAGASYLELDRLDRDVSRWLGLLGLVRQYLPDEPQTRTVRSVLALIDRMSVPARKLDFCASRASVTHFDGNKWSTDCVTTYKK
ncbi:MAG: hypothetical protein JXQ73_28350 [Phycisphaerae bacterium]|nr:hypothetical protein [Phycisphaerae bacterium]